MSRDEPVTASGQRSTRLPAGDPTEADRLWIRLVDVDRALAGRRYTSPLNVVRDIQDGFCPWNTGRFRLRADGDTVSCERADASPDLRLTSAELGAAFLGGTT